MAAAESPKEPVYLNVDEALALHSEIKGLPLESARNELRDEGLLQSALIRPQQAAHYANADIAEQAAFLLCGIAENQPFIDGNKRTALVVALTFLEVNGYFVDLIEDEFFGLMYQVADHLEVAEVAARLRPRLQPLA